MRMLQTTVGRQLLWEWWQSVAGLGVGGLDADQKRPPAGGSEKSEGKVPPPSRRRAYGQYLDAIRRNPELANATDRDVYNAVKEQLDTGERLPTFATWSKYVRECRTYHDTNKNGSRASREHSKSVVRCDEI